MYILCLFIINAINKLFVYLVHFLYFYRYSNEIVQFFTIYMGIMFSL